MNLNEIKSNKNLKRNKTRRGKGVGSGFGKTAGRGMNGQKCRSGGNIPNWFEGGQMPIHRRLPRKGFTNIFRKVNQTVSLNELVEINENIIDIKIMKDAELISFSKKKKFSVKILANKENKFDKKKIIKANKFSKKAVELIEKVGGKAEVV
ncbi:MAG: 50S ribosomal protein L15 [Candidatus Cloacimonetes bacterium]|nr:50S ribosomal protein L15 [Candidatus Cloacimonadota bacterium]MBL7108597.1 50S ribosomal protein L15 [Candidatus Cloacimonadota bacterium]